MKKKLTLAAKITFNVTAILLGFMMTGTVIAGENVRIITSTLTSMGFKNQKTFEVVTVEGADELDTEYYKSDYTNLADLIKAGEQKGEEAVAEGAVLLKNSNALPLPANNRSVSLFSVTSVDPVYGGSGSGGMDASRAVTFKQAFERAQISINTELWDWYESNKPTLKRSYAGTGSLSQVTANNDANWAQLPSAKTNPAYAAILVIGRVGGEGFDMKMTGFSSASDATNGNYLELTPKEKDILVNLKAEKDKGTFQKIIVLLNSANQIETAFLNNSSYGIDGALWIGSVGLTGLYAVGEILTGAVNPSGRLSDMYWEKHSYNPVHANYGVYSYTNGGTSTATDKYVVYQEGMYVGYRYAETRYEDVVMNTPKTGTFNYGQTVSYAFGYGLSYTSFEYSNFSAVKNAGARTYRVSVDVTNTGNRVGKEAVQFYMQRPYTDYDMDNAIEKPSIELIGFSKTDALSPNQTQTVQVDVEERWFAAYDAHNTGTYVITAGDYYLATGFDAHDALNNVLAAKGYTPANTSNRMDSAGDASFAKQFSYATLDKTTYSRAQTGKEIKNLFDFADINRYEGAGTNAVRYISRGDWAGTVKMGLSDTNQRLNNHVVLSKTAQMTADQAYNLEKDSVAYPTYGESAGINLVSMRVDDNGDKIEYDDPIWDEFMNQLTWDEIANLLRRGFRMTDQVESVAKPETVDHNGPAGLTQPYGEGSLGLAAKKNDPLKNEYPMAWPCNGIIASSFNVVLSKEIGENFGEDALWAGYSGLYGTGVNIHRSPYQGRVFEYFSEDAILTGYIVAEWTKGIQSKGCYVYNKHLALNDQEENRRGICTWANEQTIREVYLRAFEIPILEGGAMNIMTGHNRIGAVWAGASKELCTDFLRGECGMEGFVVSDYWEPTVMHLPTAILAGNDLPDGDTAVVGAGVFNAYREGYGELAWAMRESAKRILYTCVHSNAMNGFSPSTYVVRVTPNWLKLVYGIDIALAAICAISLCCLVTMLVLPYIKRKKGN